MTEDEVIEFVRGLAGVEVMTADAASGAPQVAWGDTFFYRGMAPHEGLPFATIVTKNYPGFDEASELDRPGAFRVNIAVGRRLFEGLFGHPPAGHAEHRGSYDYAAADVVMPHPVYAVQGWVSVVQPGEATSEQLCELLAAAHERAGQRIR